MFRGWLTLGVVVLALSWFGCTSGDDDDTVSGDDDDARDDDSGDDDTVPEEPYLVGNIYDLTCSVPVEGMRVTVCQADEACKFMDTDADGQYLLGGLVHDKDGEFRVRGHINVDQRPFTGLITTFDIPETGYLEAVEICLPEIDAVVALSGGEQEIEAGDGLVLTLDPDDVDWELDTQQIGAIEVPDTAWQYVAIEGIEVLGVWAMYVWGGSTETPAAVQMPFRGDLGCEDQVTIYEMSDKEIGFVEVGPGVLDCDALTVTSEEGGGLTEFTWVAYGRPE